MLFIYRMIDPLIAFRHRLERYGPLSEASYVALLEGCRVERYPRGNYLLRHGEVARTRYYVAIGLIASIFHAADGTEHLKNFFTEDYLAGSIASCLSGAPSRFDLVALEASTVVAYDNVHYLALVETHPDLNRAYRRHLEQSWVIRNQATQMDLATLTAAERYRKFLQQRPGLEQRVTQRQIASHLGITPTQLSRIRSSVYGK